MCWCVLCVSTLQIPGTVCAVFKGCAIKSVWLEHTLTTEEEHQGTKLERVPKRSASPHSRGEGGYCEFQCRRLEERRRNWLGTRCTGMYRERRERRGHYCQHCWLVTKWSLVSRMRNSPVLLPVRVQMLVLKFSTVAMRSKPLKDHFPYLQSAAQYCTYLIRVVVTITWDGCSKSSLKLGCRQNQVGLIPGKKGWLNILKAIRCMHFSVLTEKDKKNQGLCSFSYIA